MRRRDSLNEGVTLLCSQMQRIDDEEIVINKYTIEKCLGQGNFACVSSCRACDDNSRWALKEIDLHQVEGKEYCIENEAELMFRHRHRAIVDIREAFKTPYSYYLVLEIVDVSGINWAQSIHCRTATSSTPLSVKDHFRITSLRRSFATRQTHCASCTDTTLCTGT